MSNQSPTEPFAHWREKWSSDPICTSLLFRADGLMARRRTGNHRFPSPLTGDNTRAAAALQGLLGWIADSETLAEAESADAIALFLSELNSVISAIVWPRWLCLEHCLNAAWVSRDILFAALTMRTMCETLQRMHALDVLSKTASIELKTQNARQKQLLKNNLSILVSELSPISRSTILEGKDFPAPTGIDAAKELAEIHKTLNGFVHPNYASHVAALYPESPASGQILTGALVALYESFFRVSWSERRNSIPSRRTRIAPATTWQRTYWTLTHEKLPALLRRERLNPVGKIRPDRVLKVWASSNRPDVLSIVTDEEMGEVLEELPEAHDEAAVKIDGRTLPYLTWDGAGAKQLLLWSTARRIDHEICTEFSSGAPEPTDQKSWLRFHSLALLLAAHVDYVKSEACLTQLARHIVAGNPIGIHLCVRSLVEHLALSRWLVEKFGRSLFQVQAGALAANDLQQGTHDLEAAIRKFLAGQSRGAPGELKSWARDSSDGPISEWLRLTRMVDEAFSGGDPLKTIYQLSCAVMHGRLLRGIELLQKWDKVVDDAERFGIAVLDGVLDYSEAQSTLAAAAGFATTMMHASSIGGTHAAQSDADARHIMGHDSEPLIHGRDFTGEGTFSRPFELNRKFQFHTKSYALLRQLGEEPNMLQRRIDKDSVGKFCDRWSSSKREYWIRISDFPSED